MLTGLRPTKIPDVDRPTPRTRGVPRVLIPVLALALWALGPAALAQQRSPAPITIDGEVSGGLAQGGSLEFRADVASPGGWQNSHLIRIEAVSGGKVLDTLVYDVEDAQLTVGEAPMIVGTGADATSSYLHVDGAAVFVTTGGAHIVLSLTAQVLQTLPGDTRFRFTAVDDYGETASVTRELGQGVPQGLSWGTVIAAVIAALLAGGLAGSMVTSRRRPPQRFSVYGTISRRIDDERSSTSRT